MKRRIRTSARKTWHAYFAKVIPVRKLSVARLLLVVVLLLTTIGIGLFTNHVRMMSMNTFEAAVKQDPFIPVITKKTAVVEVQKEQVKAPDQIKQEPAKAPQQSTTTKTTIAGPPVSGSGTPTHQQPFSGPFVVSSFNFGQVFRVCSGDDEIVYVYSAFVGSSSSKGGTVQYRLEVDGLDISAEDTTNSVTIPSGQTYVNINSAISAPAPVYVATVDAPHPAYKIRLITTSPNSVATAWFSSPARNAGEPCIPS